VYFRIHLFTATKCRPILLLATKGFEVLSEVLR
jgi:hypothetical protein